MSQPIEERLLQVIEKDDVKAFGALMNESQCGKCRLGRFPVLSLLYLYDARKITAAYEERLLKVSTWKELREPASVAKLFSGKAGKCLRLYVSEVVSPLEMLLILDKTKRLKKIYPLTNPSDAVKTRLQSIYSVKYSLGIKFEGNEIKLDRRPLTRREKRKVLAVCLACFFAVAVIVAVPVTTVALLPAEGEITKFSQIDFGSQTTYTLKKDITVPENYSGGKVNCSFIGGGHKLILGKNATLGEFNGRMSDLEVQTSGSPIFTECTVNAELSNVTVHVDANVEISKSTSYYAVTHYGTFMGAALIAILNNGTFDGVTVNVEGNLSVSGEGMAEGGELIFGGMVMVNSYKYITAAQRSYGTIKNCTVNYSDFSLDGELNANASFGGIVGANSGVVEDCTVTGEITADTFDLAGACYYNGNTLSGVVNTANLTQTSESDKWSPVVGGIVIENASLVVYCKNTGDLTLEGRGTAISGGIAARSYGQISYCMSDGDITATASVAFVGCIFGRGEVVSSGSYIYFGVASYCIGEGKIDVTVGDGASCIGGIGGLVQEGGFLYYQYDEDGNLLLDEDDKPLMKTIYWGGGITNCIFLGEIEGNFNYTGSIVGVCGANIYEENSYTSGDTEYVHFEGNYYLETDLPSFGAVVTLEEEQIEEEVVTKEVFAQVQGKGAASATTDEIKNTKVYKEILDALGM